MSRKKSVAVIGMGQFGYSIVEELVNLGIDVIAIDNDETKIKKVGKLTPTAFIADSTNEESLIHLGLKDVQTAIVAFGNHQEASILTTVLLKDLGVPHIITRVDNEHYSQIVKKIGADEIVTPQATAGKSIANRINSDDIVDFYRLGGKYSIVKIIVNEKFQSLMLKDMNIRKVYGVNIVLITRGKKSFVPGGEDSILANDVIHVAGTEKQIETFTDFLNGK